MGRDVLSIQCGGRRRGGKCSLKIIMRIVILVSALLTVCWADNPKDDVQFMNIKSVKGGGGGYQYRGDQNFNRFFNSTQHGYAQVNHTTVNHEVGVCYVEVPTATLVRDPKHIPAGNGSRPDLSRIRTCCAGYIRNIHNFHICDPVCSTECVNALCTAPNTCSCFPDHVKNLGGFCVATCPIGCQNGHCSGGECLCKEGFTLDVNGRFCVPHCRENCGGIGNCTAPNICACRPGYASTPEGSCKPSTPGSHPQPGTPGSYPQPGAPGSYPQPGASGSYPQRNTVPGSQPCGNCINGYCMGTECRCRPGYLVYKGKCEPLCMPNCGPNTECVSPNVCAPKPGPSVNTNQPQNNSSYPNYPQNPYPYPHSTQNNTYQNPSQYPYGQHPQNQNQYPYPNNQNPQYPGNPQNNTYPPNRNPTNQYQGTVPGVGDGYPGNQNRYPGQSNGYPYPNQPNGTNQGQYPQQPGHQHLYPELPSNNYPNNFTNYGRPNRTDGQVFYQNRPYNPLENVTYNLQQGGSEQTTSQGQNWTQGQHYGGQYSHGQHSDGQHSHGQNSQGQYDQGQYGQEQYGQGQYGQGQYGQTQHGQGQNSQGQYGQGQYSQGSYGHGQFSQGQHGQGEYVQGQHGQGQNPYGQSVVYDHTGPPNQGQGIPYCEQPCINGNCIGPNTCECFPGYNKDQADPTGTRCIPHCPGGCVNGFCSAPNSCVCNVGFYKDFSVKGRSSCVRRVRRSAEEKPLDVADLLVYDIPDY